MSPRLVFSSVKWLTVVCVLIMQIDPSLQASIVAPGGGSKTICDPREFRQAIVRFCTFTRRDVQQPISTTPDRYFYNVNESESGTEIGSQGHQTYDKVVFSQLGKETLFFPVEVYTAKVKRHREFALHRKCCLSGCYSKDFAGVCKH